MAQYQKTYPREDTVPRRALTAEDIDFLAKLQTTLNTQDTMGNADPRFWVIRQTERIPCAEDEADSCRVVFDDEPVAGDMFDFIGHLKSRFENKIKAIMAHPDAGTRIQFLDNDGRVETEQICQNIQDILDALENAGLSDGYEVYWEKHVPANVQDTLFLTHQDCEAHLRAYSYNYEPDAHAFAMTAVRSPRFEQLIRLLQTVDWTALAAKTGDCV